jgi:phage-related minor tail protein
MKADIKQVFLFVLGIIIFILIYNIAYSKIYGVEGMWNPFKGIVDTIKSIVKGITEIIDFICYLGYVMRWFFDTVKCLFAVFSPLYCPLIRIIDMIIALIGFVIGSVLRLFGLGIIVNAFNKGVDGLDDITNTLLGAKITDWHAMLGVDKKCYWCKFKPFPQRK